MSKIQNIEKLKDFGIYRSHTNLSVDDFVRYNLFYGFNGSGKTTLSHLFRSIENKAISKKHSNSEFVINIKNGSPITSSNLSNSNLNIYTFNKDFIDENISWGGVSKSILLVDKTKIIERTQLNELIKVQKKEEEKLKINADKFEELDRNIASFQSATARRVRTGIQSIGTSNSYYINYDKRDFIRFVKTNTKKISSSQAVLNSDEVSKLTNAAKPNKKNILTINIPTLFPELFNKAESRLSELLITSVVSKLIQRLVDNNDINSWVEMGTKLHKEQNSNKCEFCRNTISEERLQELEEHFNNAYKKFQQRLKSAEAWMKNQYIDSPALPAEGDLYDEFKEEYSVLTAELHQLRQGLNHEIESWHEKLKIKVDNPLETNFSIQKLTKEKIFKFNEVISQLQNVIKSHNSKTNNFSSATEESKARLELHYIAEEIKDFDYFSKEEGIKSLEQTINVLKEEVVERKKTINQLEDSLSNESLAAVNFNESLHKFLGRSELSLRFNTAQKGYEIIRSINGGEVEGIDGNLSEGEKTAIAFVYFVTKLTENDNKIEDTIVVVDDPISSFDSNHLFHAYSFLKLHCEDAKQLFVLTHNFTFFKLIRDWVIRKNKKDKSRKTNIYTINASNVAPRQSTYKNAANELIYYHSEYHYVFSRLYKLKEQEDLKLDDCYLAANLSRKLLESFCNFKFPKSRGGFKNLFDAAISASHSSNKIDGEKIYKFINQYSHNDFIELDASYDENLLGESISILSGVFSLISELDEQHYDEMLAVIES